VEEQTPQNKEVTVSKFNKDKFDAVLEGLGIKKIRTLGPKVMVLPHDPDEVTAGGLIIPESAKKKTAVGTIVQIGQDTETIDGYVKGIEVGKHVSYPIVEGKEHAIAVTQRAIDQLDLKERSITTLVIHAGNLYIDWEE
jgi:chaperonin GroES